MIYCKHALILTIITVINFERKCMERKKLTNEAILKVLEILTQKVGQRIEKHGVWALASPAESLGVITEEYWELIEATKSNDPYRQADELFDIAVAAVVSIASMVDVSPVEAPSESDEVVEEPTRRIYTVPVPAPRPSHCSDCDTKGYCDGPCEGE